MFLGNPDKHDHSIPESTKHYEGFRYTSILKDSAHSVKAAASYLTEAIKESPGPIPLAMLLIILTCL